MRKISLKLLMRRFVLATSFPPFLQVYRATYALVACMTVRFFRKYPAVKTVYLRRGGGKGEILPLVSDLDFAVIWEKMNEGEKKELYRAYEGLAQAVTLLDQVLEDYDEETFYKCYETNYNFQYRFTEGKKTWKLLYGKDCLANLPELSTEKMYGGLYMEMQVWWSIFAGRFFQARKYNEEAVTRNNVCYKTVSEILKMNLALNHNVLTFAKGEALERAKAHLGIKEGLLIEKLKTVSQKRFRINDEGIVEETKNFLLTYLDRFYGEFKTHSFARPLRNITQRVECPEGEWLRSEEEHTHIRRLVGCVREKWSDAYRSAYLVPSAHFNMDELILMIEVDPERLPTVREIRELNLLHLDLQPRLRSRINLFLLLPNAAFQIDPEDVKKT